MARGRDPDQRGDADVKGCSKSTPGNGRTSVDQAAAADPGHEGRDRGLQSDGRTKSRPKGAARADLSR